jgi:hypothetical protein
MPRIELPDGSVLDVTPPTQAETDIIELLKVIARMLDMLVRLECNATKRADLKRDILETEAAIKAYQEEQASGGAVPTAEEAVAAAEVVDAQDPRTYPDGHDQYHGKDPEQDNLPEALTSE